MKKIMKQSITPICCLLFLTILFLNLNDISDYFIKVIQKEPEIVMDNKNPYVKEDNYLFIQSTENFVPYSKQDIKNIFYTIVNNGWKKFTFYCPIEYTNCISDVKTISQDQDLLTHLNNFVHPYNGFSNVKTLISETGGITVSITYFYEKEDILKISQKVEDIYQLLITDEMDTYTKIKTIHDYIINTTKYDVERNNNKTSNYKSYIAYGPLFEGYATCNGYTDAMALFLIKMGIPNFKVAMTPEAKLEEGHVWNALYLDGKWLHLDLTWDDPVSSDGEDYLEHTYFLITTKELEDIDSKDVLITEHNFKKNIYLELK